MQHKIEKNVLTNRPKTSDITKRDMFQLNFSQSDEKYDKNAVARISAVFGTLQHVGSPRVF